VLISFSFITTLSIKKADAGTFTCVNGFTDTFSGTTIDSSKWMPLYASATADTLDNSGISQNNALNISPTTPSSGTVVGGIQTVNSYSGDFVVEATINNVNAQLADNTKYSHGILNAWTADTTQIAYQHKFNLGWEKGLTNGFSSYSTGVNVNGDPLMYASIIKLPDNGPIKLKMIRLGSSVNLYID